MIRCLCTFYATQIMIVRRRVVVVSYINVFFPQSYVNYYATGQLSAEDTGGPRHRPPSKF